MTIKRAGHRLKTYADRCKDDLRCVCRERGDYVTVDGKGPYCVIIEREFFKYDIDGDVGVNSSTIELIWLKCDCLPIECDSVIRSGSTQFIVKNSPVDMFDGWCKAEAMLHCEQC